MKISLPQHMKKTFGFTLIELMIAIVIAAILIGIALPSFRSSIENTRIKTQADNIFTSLVTARSEAVKRNQRVIMCKSANGTDCVTTGNWEQGWLIYNDMDGNATVDGGADEVVIAAYSAAPANITIRTGATYTNRVIYRTDGTSTADTFTVCANDDTDTAREVIVSLTGRPAATKTTDDCGT